MTKIGMMAVSALVWGGAAMSGAAWSGAAWAQAQTSAAGSAAPAASPAAKQAAPAAQPRPLQLQSLDPAGKADPFPAVNPANFNVDSPSVATVESYLKSMMGYDAQRIWRVAAIQKTSAPGVVKVVAFVSEKTPNAKVLQAVFFVLPDGKHMVADASGVQPFGAKPFAEVAATLRARADGPSKGAASKDLMLVEFADLQCPHCKDAQPIMANLQRDFPQAHIVYESFPLVELHPYAYKAAAYGACIAKQNSEAFFTYAQAVYDTQGALLPDTVDETLKNAVTKAGMNPATIATCADGAEAKKMVDGSTALAREVGVDQTPTLAVNGRLLPMTSISYETLTKLIAYQASLDGIAVTAPAPRVAPAVPAPRAAPSLTPAAPAGTSPAPKAPGAK